VLGKNAGVYKFLFLIAVVIVLNILYYGNGS
jgi:hypothetical protein